MEQRYYLSGLLWVSEFMSSLSSNSFPPPGLHWSDVELLSSSISLTLRQIPFERVSVLLSQLPIHLPAQYVPCTTMPILYHWLTNLTHPSVVVGFPLSRVQVTSAICQLLKRTGIIQSHYSSYSFHIAAAMTAAAAALPATLIKALAC